MVMTTVLRALFGLLVAVTSAACTAHPPLTRMSPATVQQQQLTRTRYAVTPLTAWPAGLDRVQAAEQQAFITWAQQANPSILAMTFNAGSQQRSIQRLSAQGRTLGYYVSVTGAATEVDDFGQMEAAFVQGFLYDDAQQSLVWMGSAYDVNEAQPPLQLRHRHRAKGGFEVVGSADVPAILEQAKARTQQEHASWLKATLGSLLFKPMRSLDPVPCIELRLDGASLGWFTTAHTQGFDGTRIDSGFHFVDWLGTDGSTVDSTLARLNPHRSADTRFVPLSH